MNKLTKLTIKQFRNVEPTTLEFSPGINVLLGKNAAGKTTLLRLLSKAMTPSEEALTDDVFEVSYASSGGKFDVEHTIKQETVIERPLSLEPGQSMGGELSSLHRTDSLVFSDKKTREVLLKVEVLPDSVVFERAGKQIRYENKGALLGPFYAIGYALMASDIKERDFAAEIFDQQIRSAGRMDESLEGLDALLEFEVTRDGPFFKLSMANVPRAMYRMKLDELPSNTSATFSFAFLDRVAHILGYDSAAARLDVERLGPGPQNIRLSNLRFFFARANEEISHSLLSYGQKRLLAFFAHADASIDVIITDELVNGLHHEWIKACLDEIGPRQAFLTSQNPLLLDFLRFESAEEVRRTFILCERVQHESGARLVWRNPTEDEAESFFTAYQTGIQRVSDILLTKGLW
jgi:energy-coupling factor transporter ATP-binding protein EcfA2